MCESPCVLRAFVGCPVMEETESVSKRFPRRKKTLMMLFSMVFFSTDEKSLIQQAQSGNVRAFETLVSTHQSAIRRFARAWVRSAEEADELAQEALVKVYRNLKAFRFQSSFQTWLFVVVRHTFFDLSRSRQASEKALEDPISGNQLELPSEDVGADGQLEIQQEKQRLWHTLRQLPPEFKTALVLYDIEGYSYEEVAEIEGVPVGTVKSRLARGRKLLAELWNETWGTKNRDVSSNQKTRLG